MIAYLNSSRIQSFQLADFGKSSLNIRIGSLLPIARADCQCKIDVHKFGGKKNQSIPYHIACTEIRVRVGTELLAVNFDLIGHFFC